MDVEMAIDPDENQTSEELVKKMVNFILNGVSPVEEAPEVPAEYWKKLQDVSHRRISLAGYRIADLVISAGDQIATERTFVGKALDTVD